MSIAVTTTDPTNTGVSTTSSSSLTGSNAADLQSSFLTLLVAQLKNQDPTNPMENNELTSQLAQISTVSGIEKLNTTLGSISGQIDNSQSLQASNLIGHGVMIPGTTVLAGSPLVRLESELLQVFQNSIKQLQCCNNEFEDKNGDIHQAHTRLLWFRSTAS